MFGPVSRWYASKLTGFLFVILLSVPILVEHGNNRNEKKAIGLKTASALKRFGFFLEEVSASSGVDFMHSSPRLDPLFEPILPQIASMGASVSVCDFDRDGWNDFYVTNSRYNSKNSLYHNQKNGSFRDVAPDYGLADMNMPGSGTSMGSVWADIDNDGYEEILIYKWGRPELFKNEQGKAFANITSNSGLPGWINSNTAIWLDYNSDGHIDLFIGGYFPEDIDMWNIEKTSILTESFEYSQNGGRNYLLENTGEGRFIDVSRSAGLQTTRWTLAACAADMNGDGYPELMVANDYGVDEFYVNNGGGGFTEKGISANIGFSPKSGMNASLGDIHNDGNLGIYISNITEDGILLQGNNLWIPAAHADKLSFKDLAVQKGIVNGGWSYGAQFGDLNNDGFNDLFLANGYISAQRGTDYWYDYAKVTGGNTAIISDINNWPAMNGRSQSGYQINKVWISHDSQYFEDASEYVTDHQSYDSRAVAFADLWNRGVLDVIIANQNNKLLVYRNTVAKENNWIAFLLEGTRTNKSAIGAAVKVYWNGQVQKQVVTGGMGFSSQNQRRLHFGLGKAGTVDKVQILWPTGSMQEIINPETGKLHQLKEQR